MLNSVEKQHININILNTLMMKTECRTITKHGTTFLNMQAILGLRETLKKKLGQKYYTKLNLVFPRQDGYFRDTGAF